MPTRYDNITEDIVIRDNDVPFFRIGQSQTTKYAEYWQTVQFVVIWTQLLGSEQWKPRLISFGPISMH